MVEIRLHRGDFRVIKPVAQKLFRFWGDKKDSDFWLTLNGIGAEYAVIKYLNETLLARPKIDFREQYENGRDGGIDFYFPSDMSWDVKSTSSDTLDAEYALRSKAQIICGVKTVSRTKYEIWGFALKSKLPTFGEITKAHFKHIELLKRLYPDKFCKYGIPEDPKNRKYKSEFERAGNFVVPIALDIDMQCNTGKSWAFKDARDLRKEELAKDAN